MAKAYWIAHVDVTDPEMFKEYQRLNALAFAKYGAKFLVRGGQSEIRGGTVRSRHVVIEFDSLARAKACYDSPEYQAAVAVRDRCSKVDIVIVEGIAG